MPEYSTNIGISERVLNILLGTNRHKQDGHQ